MQKLKFQPADPQRPELGFTIIDPSVMVVAFQQLQRQIQEIKQQSGIVLVELADDDYKLFFEQLQPESCQNRHILFFEAELEAKNTRHTKEFLEQVKTYVKQKVIPQALL